MTHRESLRSIRTTAAPIRTADPTHSSSSNGAPESSVTTTFGRNRRSLPGTRASVHRADTVESLTTETGIASNAPRSSRRLSGSMASVALAGAALTAALPAAQAQAMVDLQTIVPCSTDALVTAIVAANSHSAATVILPGNCTYDITTPATATDGLPIITGHITLAGGANTVIRRSPGAPTAFRILDVAAGGTLSLHSISVLNGSTNGLGGGIQNAGTLVVDQAKLSGNTAGNGGALANVAGATARVSRTQINANTTTGVGGGGIINSGTLTLATSVLSGNTAPINGGGLNTQTAGPLKSFRAPSSATFPAASGAGCQTSAPHHSTAPSCN